MTKVLLRGMWESGEVSVVLLRRLPQRGRDARVLMPSQRKSNDGLSSARGGSRQASFAVSELAHVMGMGGNLLRKPQRSGKKSPRLSKKINGHYAF